PRPTATSTRFPYPTLFRSLPQEVEGLRVIDLGHALLLLFFGHRFGARGESNAQSDDLAIGGRFVELATRQRQQTCGGRAVILAGDRKSTRLNSSHVKISYA